MLSQWKFWEGKLTWEGCVALRMREVANPYDSDIGPLCDLGRNSDMQYLAHRGEGLSKDITTVTMYMTRVTCLRIVTGYLCIWWAILTFHFSCELLTLPPPGATSWFIIHYHMSIWISNILKVIKDNIY